MNVRRAPSSYRMATLVLCVSLVHVGILYSWSASPKPTSFSAKVLATRVIFVTPTGVDIRERSWIGAEPKRVAATSSKTPAPSQAIGDGAQGDLGAREPLDAIHSAPQAVASTPLPIDGESALPALSIVLPPPRVLQFSVTEETGGQREEGRAEFAWRHDGTRYEVLLQSEIAGRPYLKRSSGRITEAGLAPQSYLSDSLLQPIRTQSTTQDPLSLIVQIATLIAGSPQSYPPGSSIHLSIPNGTRSEPADFSVQSAEAIKVSGKATSVLKVVGASQRMLPETELWLAADLGYLPMRFRVALDAGGWREYVWNADPASPPPSPQ